MPTENSAHTAIALISEKVTVAILPNKQLTPRPRHEDIARRAYEMFEARGGVHGFDVDDWLHAERELWLK